ncbi:hypothetical protein BKA67DRAFT_663155 [Truncatella angustata]|uniref:Uncharacterized protein n=1 Tax=Truncatella angustata TaxID=152316 RepID=A0A9P8UD48_9PEZI|nr:uncharacterized protein BKA67DRAFT_663155 [Truncatella angustata]KAH6646762.1 hypothetical protein BKA67DRAFT_663155 [Truncatella angustata]
MPRDGGGRSHNAYDLSSETNHDITHGAGNADNDPHVSRADRTAEMPQHEPGAAVQNMNASAGHSQGLAEGPERGQGGRSTKA